MFQADQPSSQLTGVGKSPSRMLAGFLYLRVQFKRTTKPGWSSSPWWTALCAPMKTPQSQHAFHPTSTHSPTAAMENLSTFVFHLNIPRMERSSGEKRREPKPRQKSGTLETDFGDVGWQRQQQQQGWPEICEWQKDPSSTFPFLAALEVEATPSGHWLDELSDSDLAEKS